MQSLPTGLVAMLSLLWLGVAEVAAHGDGMDMSMDGPMNLAQGSMIPYLHFAPGDILWFLGWVPKSRGAMVGTCIGLFLLGIVDRWIAAMRAMMEVHWRMTAQLALANKLNSSKDAERSSTTSSIRGGGWLNRARLPPFIPAQDLMRGVIHLGQVSLGFAFMLAVMTYQAAFIIAIIFGLAVGETLFGRFIGASGHHV